MSIKGESYLFLGQQQKPSLLKNNHYLLFGPSYHFGKNNLDLYASFQPGINFSQPNLFDHQLNTYDLKVIPAASISVGSCYYFWKYFIKCRKFISVAACTTKLHGSRGNIDCIGFGKNYRWWHRRKWYNHCHI